MAITIQIVVGIIVALVAMTLSMRFSYWLVHRGWEKHCVCPKCGFHATIFEYDACPNCLISLPYGGLLGPQRWMRFSFFRGWQEDNS